LVVEAQEQENSISEDNKSIPFEEGKIKFFLVFLFKKVKLN